MFAWPEQPMLPQSSIDTRAFRNSLGAFPSGVCLVSTVGADGKREGMTINSFASVSLTPPLVLWSVRQEARSADVFLSAPHFVVSILAADQQSLALAFAKPAPDKFAAWEDHFETGLGGCPRLKQAVATYECSAYSCHREGDHSILVGQVLRLTHQDHEPLMFLRGRVGSLAELAESAVAPAARSAG